jgi:hypothetical protein
VVISRGEELVEGIVHKNKKNKKRGSQIEIFNGFIKQVPRAIYNLLDGAFKVSIEAEDDISIYDNTGKITKIEQLKHKKSDNVLSNTSDDLWGTLYNWIYNYVEEPDKNKYSDNCAFVIFLRNKSYKQSKCLEEILSLGQDTNFDKMIENCEKYLKNCKNDDINKKFNYIKQHKEEATKILKNFSVVTPQINISCDLNNLIASIYGDTYGSDFLFFAETLNSEYYKLIYNREEDALKKCVISQENLSSIQAKYDKFRIKVQFVQGTLTETELAQLRNELFVAQLNCIDCNDSIILSAKKSYKSWKNCEEKDLLSGRVTQEVLNKTYSNLKDNWENEKLSISPVAYPTAEKQGQYLYSKVQGIPVNIDGIDLQGDKRTITRGAYNYLANKELDNEYSVGWHPEYKEQLKDWNSNE